MFHTPLKNLWESDDDDLPNFSDRIQSMAKAQNSMLHQGRSDSDSDESDFLKFSERIRNTPRSQTVYHQEKNSNKENEACNFFKSPESFLKATPIQVKHVESVSSVLPIEFSSDSEDESQKISEGIHDVPLSKSSASHPFDRSSDSEDEVFSNLSKRFQSFCTPVSQNRTAIKCNSDLLEKKISSGNVLRENHSRSNVLKGCQSLRIPKSQNRNMIECSPDFLKNRKICSISNKTENSSASCEVLKRQQTPKYQVNTEVPTPCSKIANASESVSDSEDESEFLEFSRRIRDTPHFKNGVRFSHNITSDSDDEVFLNLSKRFYSLQKVKSQHNAIECNSDFPEKKKLFSTPNAIKENSPTVSNGILISNSWTSVQRANAEEYSKLFLSKPEVSESFRKNRASIAKQLFSFYNKKVFTLQLPEDIPIQWKNSLKSTAGFCHYKCHNGVNCCFIDLSIPLLNSFDRLQDTLIHEMCHAAVWIISKQKNVSHGPLWQVWASRCNLLLPFITCPTRCHDYKPNYRFWYFCPKCNWRRGKHKQSAKYNNGRCKICCGPVSFEEKHVS